MFRGDSIEVQAFKCTKFASSHLRNYLMRRNQNISSHAVGQRSQSNDNFTSHFEEVSQIPDNFDSQTYTNILQESSVLGSCSLHRRLNEHYQSNHHNNQVPTDQFVMNRPDVAPTSRHVFVDPITNRLNLPRYNANSNRALVPAAESSATNNSRREVVEQEHRQNTRDHPRLIRPTPYRLYDPSSSMRKAASDEISTTNNIRTDYARSRVPRLHQSSSHSGREVVEQEHGQSRRDHPQVFRPIINSLYDPRYAAIGQPVDPILRSFKQNPNFSMPKATSDENSTTNNIRTDYACSRVPRVHQSSSHSGREVVEQEHRQSRRDYPRVIRRIPNRLYDPRYAAIGLPVDPLLRAFELNPNFGLSKHDE